MKLQLQEIVDGHLYATSPYFKFRLYDEKERQFGLYVEILNMFDSTGEEEFEDYPFVVEISIVADKPHKSFNESGDKPTKLGLIYDCHSYMGGVPIAHYLNDSVKDKEGGGESFEESFDCLAKQFSPLEAKIVSQKAEFGTVAAQRGKTETKYLQFATYEAGLKYVNYLLEHRADILGTMVGFILDMPVNMVGHTGWSVIESHVKGKKH